jgi:small subunit ribosomal protein S8
MAKKSAVNRNEMVKRLVKQYAAKRLALTEIANDEARPLEERFEARLKHPQSMRSHWPAARLLSQAEDVADRAARPGFARPDPWPRQVKLVGGQMAVNDPIGDMIARIRNAAMRGRGKVLTPASKLREHVLDVLRDEGYIRGYALVQKPGEFPQFEIELKYFDNEPVIVEIARVSKPGRRVYSSIKDLKPIKNGLGISILSTPKGVMSDSAARDANVGGEVLCRVY